MANEKTAVRKNRNISCVLCSELILPDQEKEKVRDGYVHKKCINVFRQDIKP